MLPRVIREELEAVKDRLDSLEKRVTDHFARMDETSPRTEERFVELTKALEGVTYAR